MIFNIPQFIDIEDKIVVSLTAKQLGWLAGGGVCLLVAWTTFDMATFFASAIFISLIFGGLAFFRPNGQPLTMLIGSIFIFFLKPKVYIWRRVPEAKKLAHHDKKTVLENHNNKEITLEEIEKVSQLLEIKKQ